MQKVVGWIDIQAPCRSVFDTVSDVKRRMQLSPLWGMSELLEVSPEFPRPGSRYRIRVLSHLPFGIAGGMSHTVASAFGALSQLMTWKAGQREPEPELLSASPETSDLPSEPPVEREQQYVVSECEAPSRLSYYLESDCDTRITWRLQSIPRGTRVNYEETYCDDQVGGEEFGATVQRVVNEWLRNIKRYAELRGTRGRRLLKWGLDRFFLKLRPDQRRTVLLILFLQSFGLVTFVMAAIALGVAFFVS